MSARYTSPRPFVFAAIAIGILVASGCTPVDGLPPIGNTGGTPLTGRLLLGAGERRVDSGGGVIRNGIVGAYDALDTVSGAALPAATLLGNQTQLSEPRALAVNSAGELLVLDGTAILVFVNARSFNGNVAPVRTVSGNLTGLTVGTAEMVIDTQRDLLYVVANGVFPAPDKILVFADTTKSSFGGNLAPTHTIASPDLPGIVIELAVTASDELFATNSPVVNSTTTGFGSVVIFTNASQKDGALSANRVMRSSILDATNFGVGVAGMAIAPDDTLVINVSTNGREGMYLFRNASTLSGTKNTADLRLDWSDANKQVAGFDFAIDSAGTAYVSLTLPLGGFEVFRNLTNRGDLKTPDQVVAGNTADGFFEYGALLVLE